MTLEEIRNMIGYVPQEPYLYNVSIAENIAYENENVTTEEIVCRRRIKLRIDFKLKT